MSIQFQRKMRYKKDVIAMKQQNVSFCDWLNNWCPGCEGRRPMPKTKDGVVSFRCIFGNNCFNHKLFCPFWKNST